jgi:hypothetical protein
MKVLNHQVQLLVTTQVPNFVLINKTNIMLLSILFIYQIPNLHSLDIVGHRTQLLFHILICCVKHTIVQDGLVSQGAPPQRHGPQIRCQRYAVIFIVGPEKSSRSSKLGIFFLLVWTVSWERVATKTPITAS